MFVSFSFLHLILFLLPYLDLTIAKSSFNLSDLKLRQHRHDRAKQYRRDLIGLGDPLGLFPSPPSSSPSPSSSLAASLSQSSVSSLASNSNSVKATSTPAAKSSSSSNSNLLGIPGLSLPSIPGIGVGAGGGILPSITLGVGNPAPSPSPSPPPSSKVSSESSSTSSPSSSDGNDGGIGLSVPGIISLTIPPIGGSGSKGRSSSNPAVTPSKHPPILSIPPILPTTPIISLPPVLPSSPVLSIPPILPSTPIVSIPPIIPISSSGGSSGSGSSSGVNGIIPTISLPPIGSSSPTGSAGSGSPSTSSYPPIISISIPSISLPTISIPPIFPSSSGSGSGASSTIIGLPTITIPPIGPSSSSGSDSQSSSMGIIPSISISIPSISIGLPGGSTSSSGSSSGSPQPTGLPPISIPPPFSSSRPSHPVSTVGIPSSSGSSGGISSPSSFPQPGPSSAPSSGLSSTSGVSSSGSGSTMTVFQPSSESTESTTSIGSQYSFLTASSLLITSVPIATPTGTQTDPDLATSTIVMPSGGAPQSSPTLPAYLPEMILPVPPLDTSPQNLAGMTLITLLFEPQLGYQFMLNSEQTQGQVWAFMPQAIGNALSIISDDVKALWMKPYAPVGYNDDPSSLLTIFNAYIPSGSVDSMAHQIQSITSQYFVGSKGIPGQLANFTVPGFPVLFVSDPYTSSSNGGNNTGNTTVSGEAAASNKRRDAIIAVCTIIGSIALLVLGWWGYKNFKRHRESAHQRLADPLGLDRDYGATDNTMRERPPSVGPDGIRRNSFYFAEDSLRGYRNQVRDMEEEAQMASSTGGRRHVHGAAISTPILRDNTLNW